MPTINEKVLLESCHRAKREYPKYSGGVSRPFLYKLIRQVYKEEECGAVFQEALRFTLNDSGLKEVDREIYRFALGSYFGQISGLVRKARSPRKKITPPQTQKPVLEKVEKGGQIAWRI